MRLWGEQRTCGGLRQCDREQLREQRSAPGLLELGLGLVDLASEQCNVSQRGGEGEQTDGMLPRLRREAS